MPLPAYMTITSETHGEIEGTCDVEDREGTIVVQGFDHTVEVPTDERGAPSGRRVHRPVTILKEIDRASPILYQVLCTGELLTEVEITFFSSSSRHLAKCFFGTKTAAEATLNRGLF